MHERLPRAEEILTVIVNDEKMHIRAKRFGNAPIFTRFRHYAGVICSVSELYFDKGWEPFTLAEMTAAIGLLAEWAEDQRKESSK